MKRTIPILLLIITACTSDKPTKPQPEPYTQEGVASYYARMLEGRPTASGDAYTKDSLTAAHNQLPLGTILQVTNLDNDSTVMVEVNDRGPYSKNRILDLSRRAAKKLGMMESGTAHIRLEVKEAAEGYSVSDSIAKND
ncbi:septal ring lytic transglycosylase RlpA family protein [Fulvivirga ligni]|uniref:septal ring lytic transglycosylase RlpA family protein n=1 Tax=Fulvivirga ligni TaxID=2904246 RepID=UPI001F1C2D7D|nr:septal ring lytic transglycosylase RlpA family protein [Fulvivirga ligni]UII20151.1 septal ring lytic transglycosylase RlpA family protein [Fulvivirga ligni]